jgi:hypothetical protein
MTGCSRFSPGAAALILGLGLAVPGLPAMAESATGAPPAPMQLTPPRPAETAGETPGPTSIETPPPESTPPESTPPESTPRETWPRETGPRETGTLPGGGASGGALVSPAGIVAEPLGVVSADSIGLIDPGSGGLPLTLWQGLSRTDIFAALRDLPGGIVSPASRALLRRLLLSAAPVPEATAEDASVPSLLATRISRLTALGEIDAAADLAAAGSGGGRDLALARARIEALFAAGRIEAACAVQPVPSLQGYAAKVAAVCALQGGDKTAGKAALQTARQAGADAAFLALGDAVLGTGRGPSAAFAPNPFHMALYYLASATPPAAMLKLDEDRWTAALPRFKGLSATARANAAHAAAGRALIGAPALGEIYAALPLKPEEAAAALAATGPLDARAFVAMRARLTAASEPAAIAETLEKLWPRLPNLAGPEAALFAQDLRLLSPETLPPAAAAKGALLFFAQGDAIEARRWTSAAEAGAQGALLAAQWPVAVMSGVRAASFADLNAWLESKGAAEPAAAERALAALEALGEPVPNDTWRRLLANPPAPAPAPAASLLRALENAAAGGRIGEVAALALQVLGAAGPAASHPLAVAAVLRSLNAAGLDREARALALEAAIPAAR